MLLHILMLACLEFGLNVMLRVFFHMVVHFQENEVDLWGDIQWQLFQ